MKKIKDSRIPEIAVLILFAAAYIVITVFHEPWFDEAQAWQIAKCASLREILFEIPHYEGHPPLWHLILAIPSKLGVPYEPGLKTVGFLFSIAIVFLIVFRSPFPRIVRLLLPFNYFIFYQFGIIVRPYGMMLLIMLLLAIVFPKRHEKPRFFVFVLMLLCLSHSYGIMIAGGTAMCYLWDIIEEKGWKRFFREFFKDKRIRGLALLLLLAIMLVIEIMPRKDTYVASANRTNSIPLCLLCTVFTMIPDCFCLSSTWFSLDTNVLQKIDISGVELTTAVIVGIIFWSAIILCSSKKSLRYFAIPYLMFALFAAVVYFTAHHEGVALSLIAFWLWITLNDEDRFAGWKKLCAKTDGTESRIVRLGLAVFGILCLIIPIYWSVSASVHDIQESFGYGRGAAEFLKEKELDDTLIFKAWYMPDGSIENQQTLFCPAESTLLAYFDENIYANTNNGNKKKAYLEYKWVSLEQAEEIAAQWPKLGKPDVIIGCPDLSLIYKDELDLSDYSSVFLAPETTIYKNNIDKYVMPILLRNDLLDKYDVEVQDFSKYYGSYEISSSLKKAYLNGEITLDEFIDESMESWGIAD